MLTAGIDTGGTHTDVIVLDTVSGRYVATKVPTTTDDPVYGVLNGLRDACEEAELTLGDIETLVYGTTIVVNIMAQGQQLPVGLITTSGFRDILEIGRAFRSDNIYDIQVDRPEPLIPRELRFGVVERIRHDGEVVTPLDEADVRRVARVVREAGLKSVAICLLHSYKNPIHEQRVRELLVEECPDLHVSLSSEVNPQFREFERTSTTVINAFAMPAISKHLATFTQSLREAGGRARPYIMQANGGALSFREAVNRPVQVANSGPIAGVVAAATLAKESGYRNLITMDMGGTSCDVSLVFDGEPQFTSKGQVRGYPVSVPTVDLHYIGAGGGSIAWLDAGGALRVGPQSAGARPGPACYGLGGSAPTVTDANLVTGRLSATGFLNGHGSLDLTAARSVIESLGIRLGLTTDDLAEGIIDLAISNMMGAVKLISLERGYDPRDFSLLAFGGAGALHASLLAREMEIPRVIVPPSPGTFTALGTVMADVRYDHVMTDVHALGERDSGWLGDAFGSLIERGKRQLDAEGIASVDQLFMPSLDLRYAGQGFELHVPVSYPLADRDSPDGLRGKFHEAHRRSFGHAMLEQPVEVVNLRVTAVGLMPKPSQRQLQAGTKRPALMGERMVCLGGRQIPFQVLHRAGLKSGDSYQGPAIVEEMGATTLVLPDQRLMVDDADNLVLVNAE